MNSPKANVRETEVDKAEVDKTEVDKAEFGLAEVVEDTAPAGSLPPAGSATTVPDWARNRNRPLQGSKVST